MAPLPVTTGLGGNFVRCFVNKVMMSKLVRTPSIFLCVVKAESGCQRGHFLFQIAQVSINLYTCNHTMIRFYNRGKIYTFITLCCFFSGSFRADRGQLRMSATYYFTGDCTDSTVQDAIKKKFIITLSTSAYRDACLVHAKECTVENVQVCKHKPRKFLNLAFLHYHWP